MSCTNQCVIENTPIEFRDGTGTQSKSSVSLRTGWERAAGPLTFWMCTLTGLQYSVWLQASRLEVLRQREANPSQEPRGRWLWWRTRRVPLAVKEWGTRAQIQAQPRKHNKPVFFKRGRGGVKRCGGTETDKRVNSLVGKKRKNLQMLGTTLMQKTGLDLFCMGENGRENSDAKNQQADIRMAP